MDAKEAMKLAVRARCETLCKKLDARGFKTHFAPDSASAVKEALELIAKEESVGIAGTVTVREVGLYSALTERGNSVIDHWEQNGKFGPPSEALLKEIAADWVVMSVNAIDEQDGTLVNIDGTGNRTAAMSWGPGKLLIIAGVNKLAQNLEGAMARAKNDACVPNAIRVGGKAPCAKTGVCMNCNSDAKICNIIMMMTHAVKNRETHIIIVGENLGY